MSRTPLIPALAVLAIAGPVAAADLSDVQFHGFASQGYLYTTVNNYYGRTKGGGTFEFNEFALNAVARPVDRVRIGVQIFAGDQGKYGNDKLQLDWAYGSYQLAMPVTWADLNVTAGRFKTGHGLYNDYRDLDMTRTTVFLPMTVYPSTFRDLYMAANGFQLNGSLRAGPLGSFDVSGFVGTQTIDNQAGTPVADQLGQGFFNITNIDVKRMDGASLTWNTPLEGLRFRGSFLHASDVTATGQLQEGYSMPIPPPAFGVLTLPTNSVKYILPTWQSVILGGEYQHGNLTLAAEYLNEYYNVSYDYDSLTSMVLGSTHNEEYSRIQGAYANAAYRFHPKWEGAVGYAWMMMDDGTTQSVANDELKRREHRGFSFALRFDPIEHWLIKAEFQRNSGTLNVSTRDNPDGLSKNWNMFALKTTFDF